MSIRQIPAESWTSFLDSFSRQHHGWLVTISRGDERVASDEPLDFARAIDHAIVVSAGGREYRLEDARAIAVNAAGTAIGHIEIAGAKESMTIRFREVISPELVDGVVP